MRAARRLAEQPAGLLVHLRPELPSRPHLATAATLALQMVDGAVHLKDPRLRKARFLELPIDVRREDEGTAGQLRGDLAQQREAPVWHRTPVQRQAMPENPQASAGSRANAAGLAISSNCKRARPSAG